MSRPPNKQHDDETRELAQAFEANPAARAKLIKTIGPEAAVEWIKQTSIKGSRHVPPA